VTPQERAGALQGEVKAHKAAIRRHRAHLVAAKVELVHLARECAARGIGLVVAEQGEEETHGQAERARVAAAS
jgi:hypothetical protein